MDKSTLIDLYTKQQKSISEIASALGCSSNKITYWMIKHGIARRHQRDANYIKAHPGGDPFLFDKPVTEDDFYLYGLGIGIYWGEGNKASKSSVRVGNTDPLLVEYFVRFLERFYGLQRSSLSFGVQIFSDIKADDALAYWCNTLNVKPAQFYKPTLSLSVSQGTYKRRSKYGVITVYFNNSRLKESIMKLLPT